MLGKSQGGFALKSVSQANLKLLPRWLNYINQQKLEQVQLAIEKIQRVFEFGNNCKDFSWNDNREFESSLRLIELKLGVVKEIIEKQAPAQVIDTYHLERFYSYASSFHDALVQAESKGRLARYFESSRLSASMEKLTLSMQYELNLFFDAIDDLYGGTVKNNPKNKQILAQRTYGCIQDKDGAVMWRDKFGIDVRQSFPFLSFFHVLTHSLTHSLPLFLLQSTILSFNPAFSFCVIDVCCVGCFLNVCFSAFYGFMECFCSGISCCCGSTHRSRTRKKPQKCVGYCCHFPHSSLTMKQFRQKNGLRISCC
jgi:hypothetical protein